MIAPVTRSTQPPDNAERLAAWHLKRGPEKRDAEMAEQQTPRDRNKGND